MLVKFYILIRSFVASISTSTFDLICPKWGHFQLMHLVTSLVEIDLPIEFLTIKIEGSALWIYKIAIQTVNLTKFIYVPNIRVIALKLLKLFGTSHNSPYGF